MKVKILKFFKKLVIFIAITLLIFVFAILLPKLLYNKYQDMNVLMLYGSLLSGIGSIALGGIALYQNKTFKEENDKAQERLERINERSNEINAIKEIISYENKSYNDIQNLLNRFSSKYSPEEIINCSQNKDKYKTVFNIIDQDFNEIYMFLLKYDDDYSKNLRNAISDFYSVAKVVAKPKELYELTNNEIDDLAFTCATYEGTKINFLIDYRNRIENALYCNLTLNEIIKLFKR